MKMEANKSIDEITYENAMKLGLVTRFKRVINAYVGLNVLDSIEKGEDVRGIYGLRPDNSTGVLYDRGKIHEIGEIPSFLDEVEFVLGFLNDDEGNAFMRVGYNELVNRALRTYDKGDLKLQKLLEDCDYRCIVRDYFNFLIRTIEESTQRSQDFYEEEGEPKTTEIFKSAYDRFQQFRRPKKRE